jgi:4-carboxymuconolactone decarboxylase
MRPACSRSPIGLDAVGDYRAILRRLSLRDDRYIDTLLAAEASATAASELDPRSHALVRVGALIAADAAPPSYMNAVEDALAAGSTREELVGALIAVLPVVGAARVVSAAPNLGLALGYDVADALEAVEDDLPLH